MSTASKTRLAAGVVAAGLVIWALILLFSEGNTTASLKVEDGTDASGNVAYTEEDSEVECHRILNADGLDWPLAENGEDAESTLASNQPILDAACAAQRTGRLGYVVLLLVPGFSIGTAAVCWRPTAGSAGG